MTSAIAATFASPPLAFSVVMSAFKRSVLALRFAAMASMPADGSCICPIFICPIFAGALWLLGCLRVVLMRIVLRQRRGWQQQDAHDCHQRHRPTGGNCVAHENLSVRLHSLQLELLDPVADLIAVQAEQRGRARLVPAAALERLDDERPLELLEVDAVRRQLDGIA